MCVGTSTGIIIFSMASESEKENKLELRPWSDLPIDILYIILSFLPYECYPHFASVCKTWRSCTSPVYPADQCPLLAHFQKWRDGICRYYSPLSNKTFVVDCPFGLSGNIAFYFARHGWLLLYRKSEIILFNPTTNTLHKSPHLDGISMVNEHCMAFLGKPPNECTIFAIDSYSKRDVEIIIWKCGLDSYSRTEHNNNMSFRKSWQSNPVPLGGLFYCLGTEGNLGVYNPNKNTWTVLPGPKQFEVSYKESFLVESDGELVSIVVGKQDRPLHIFMFNRTAMTWYAVKSIGSTRTLFTRSGMSLMTTAAVRRMGNRVYFPRFHGRPETIHAEIRCSSGSRIFFIPKPRLLFHNSVGGTRISEASICYYSLDNGEPYDYIDSKEQLYSIWFEARL